MRNFRREWSRFVVWPRSSLPRHPRFSGGLLLRERLSLHQQGEPWGPGSLRSLAVVPADTDSEDEPAGRLGRAQITRLLLESQDVEADQVLDTVQEFVQTLISFENAELLDDVWKLVEKHYKKIAAARAKKTPATRAAAEERQALQFMLEADQLFCRVRFKNSAGGVRPLLLRLLARCQNHVEVLHQRLWWDAFEEAPAAAAADAEGPEQPPPPQNVRPQSGWGEAAGRVREPPEYQPLWERLVLDVEVRWEPGGGGGAPGAHLPAAPDAGRTVLLANLPAGTTEADVRGALAPCGPLRRVEVHEDWTPRLEVPGPPRPSPKFALAYALAEFESGEGHRRAVRKAIRIFGILMQEPPPPDDPEKPRPKGKRKQCVRPAYPQDARLKHSLLIRGIPWRLEPCEVLVEFARALVGNTGGAASTCRLSLMNCAAFSTPGAGPLRSLAVEARSGGAPEVRQEPAGLRRTACASPTRENGGYTAQPSGNGGAAVLRFKRFEDAYLARQRLKGFLLGGRQVFCGFPPWRPQCQELDSLGKPLPEAVLMDLPLHGPSAHYPCGSSDPVRIFGVPMGTE